MDKERRNGRLEFIQNLDYKFIELLHCNFTQLDEAERRDAIQFRYNAAKTKLQIMEARLRDVNSLLKLKNPSLLL
jgi:hypothetical protein